MSATALLPTAFPAPETSPTACYPSQVHHASLFSEICEQRSPAPLRNAEPRTATEQYTALFVAPTDLTTQVHCLETLAAMMDVAYGRKIKNDSEAQDMIDELEDEVAEEEDNEDHGL